MNQAAAGDADRGRHTPGADESAEAQDVYDAVLAVRRGDRDAFGRIVGRYHRRLFGLMLMMVRQPAAAEELVQDAFVRAFTHLAAYDERRPFFPWLSTIAVRLSQNWLKRHTRTTSREADALDVDAAASPAADPLDEVMTDERARRLWREVAALPSGERTAVVLYYREDLPVADIATALGVTSGTVKTLLFRARRRLRTRVADDAASFDRENTT